MSAMLRKSLSLSIMPTNMANILTRVNVEIIFRVL
jgi:hypothetical protein